MRLPLVVGVDGSEQSLRAVDWAADEAALHGLPLRLVHASLWERYEGPALAEDVRELPGEVSGEDILRVAALRAGRRRAGLSVTTEVTVEEPEYVLIHESRSAFAVVVGTRGRGAVADALLGSVSLSVATRAHCPVVVARGDRNPDARHTGVVVGVTETPTAALRFAFEEAQLRQVPLTAVRAWRCPSHRTADHPLLAGDPERMHAERAAGQLRAALADAPPDLELRRRTVEGSAGRMLLAASQEAGLLVIGRRRPKHLGPHLGRVAHQVLHHGQCPVVVVPDP
ncbi:universal stress protein [Streptomyces fragilis]|uniref:Universal stress protein n=1 Tax=Streptomyces fragilis TaxID=67301 RepID=A0ABV2YRB1_9ACTN|nr:universal stress protein [Streptomyces fragilis]